MRNYNELFENILDGIDTSRGNMNKTLKPATRYYPVEYTAKPTMRMKENTAFESIEQQWQSDKEAGASDVDMAADTLGKTGEVNAGGAGGAGRAGSVQAGGAGGAGRAGSVQAGGAGGAGRAYISAEAQAQSCGLHESCADDTDFRLDFTDKNLLNGIILTEVLGKPKYFRKGRWS